MLGTLSGALLHDRRFNPSGTAECNVHPLINVAPNTLQNRKSVKSCPPKQLGAPKHIQPQGI